MAWYRVNAEGTIVSPQEILPCLPQGGVEWGQPFCLNLGCSGEVDKEKVTTTLHNEELDTGGSASSCAAAHEGGEWEVVGGDHKRARTQPTAPAEDAFATEDEEMLEGLRAELAPTSPEAAADPAPTPSTPEPASAGAVADLAPAPSTPEAHTAPTSAAAAADIAPDNVGGYPLRPRRSISASLEAFCIRKFQQASGVAGFQMSKKWLAALKEQAVAANLMGQETSTPEGLREVLRAYKQWLQREG